MLQEELVHFDGDILHWPLFSASYLDIIRLHNLDSVSQFRLLYQHIDELSKIRFLSDIDPANPDLHVVFGRMQANFEDPVKIYPQIMVSISKLPALKHRYCQESWLVLMKAANLTKVLSVKHNFAPATEDGLTKALLFKLPLKYQNMFKDNFSVDVHMKLENFVKLCDLFICVILERIASGLPTSDLKIPDQLCLLCETDYHYPQQCQLELNLRKEAIRTKGLCRRCVFVLYTPGHNCKFNCEYCGRPDHHVSICNNAPHFSIDTL